MFHFLQLQPHRFEHFQPFFLHPHALPHAFKQWHLTRWLQAFDTSSSSVQCGNQTLLSFSKVQPIFPGDGTCWIDLSAVVHIPAWYMARLECSNNAAFVGGRASIVTLSLWQKSFCRASSTQQSWLVLSYKTTVNLSSNPKRWLSVFKSVNVFFAM